MKTTNLNSMCIISAVQVSMGRIDGQISEQMPSESDQSTALFRCVFINARDPYVYVYLLTDAACAKQ